MGSEPKKGGLEGRQDLHLLSGANYTFIFIYFEFILCDKSKPLSGLLQELSWCFFEHSRNVQKVLFFGCLADRITFIQSNQIVSCIFEYIWRLNIVWWSVNSRNRSILSETLTCQWEVQIWGSPRTNSQPQNHGLCSWLLLVPHTLEFHKKSMSFFQHRSF